jgi:hypothetical protein
VAAKADPASALKAARARIETERRRRIWEASTKRRMSLKNVSPHSLEDC